MEGSIGVPRVTSGEAKKARGFASGSPLKTAATFLFAISVDRVND
jgi:hypothetical protein